MHLNELKALHVSEVLKQAEELDIENTGRMRKQELMFAIIKKRAKAGEQIFADGVLEILPDGFGFLRSPDTSYTASTDDIYISPSQVRRFNLHTGDMIEGEVRTPKDGERYFALTKLDKVHFDDLSQLDIVGIYPNYAAAYDAWKDAAQRSVDDAHMRYFIVHLHRLLDPEAA